MTTESCILLTPSGESSPLYTSKNRNTATDHDKEHLTTPHGKKLLSWPSSSIILVPICSNDDALLLRKSRLLSLGRPGRKPWVGAEWQEILARRGSGEISSSGSGDIELGIDVVGGEKRSAGEGGMET